MERLCRGVVTVSERPEPIPNLAEVREVVRERTLRWTIEKTVSLWWPSSPGERSRRWTGRPPAGPLAVGEGGAGRRWPTCPARCAPAPCPHAAASARISGHWSPTGSQQHDGCALPGLMRGLVAIGHFLEPVVLGGGQGQRDGSRRSHGRDTADLGVSGSGRSTALRRRAVRSAFKGCRYCQPGPGAGRSRDRWSVLGRVWPMCLTAGLERIRGQGRVRIRGPSSVMAMVCSMCAARLPSMVRRVHPSGSVW